MSDYDTVASRDGTQIAYDRIGEGPPLVIVGGAFSHRSWKGYRQLAELLSGRFTVVSYDRRGRGDSGDAQVYAVEREIEDLDAVVRAVGGSASVFGMSSGAVLTLRAAAAGVAVDRAVLYQPPFAVDRGAHLPPAGFGERLEELVRSGRRSAAVSYFMSKGMGAPRLFVGLLRVARPMWKGLTAVAHTLPYDYAVMGSTVHGHPLGPRPWASVASPTLVVDGERSPASLHRAADELAAVLPRGRRETLPGQGHNVSMKALAPVMETFLTGAR